MADVSITADDLEAQNLAELKRGLAIGTDAWLAFGPDTDVGVAEKLAKTLLGDIELEIDHTGGALLVRPVADCPICGQREPHVCRESL